MARLAPAITGRRARAPLSAVFATTLPALALALGLAVCLALVPPPLHADGDGGDGGVGVTDPDHAEALRLIGKGAYAQAVPVLQKMLARDGQNADAHNLMGFVMRKQGQPEQALSYYRTALEIAPGHRGAHEYIGEAYLALGQLDKALEHLKFLDDDCWLPCAEYSDLKEAVARYKARTGG